MGYGCEIQVRIPRPDGATYGSELGRYLRQTENQVAGLNRLPRLIRLIRKQCLDLAN